MPNGYIIAEDQYLGTFHYASQAADSWGWMSRAYFCKHCGEIWARRIVLNSKGDPQYFRAIDVACRNHSDPWAIPGSLLADELVFNLDTLSPEAVARELDVHLAYYERQL
jgi:hypothetical protein